MSVSIATGVTALDVLNPTTAAAERELAVLVADSGVSLPRYQVIGTEGGTPRPFALVDGGASAGSKHLLGSADALVEQTRIDFDSADSVKTIVVHVALGQGSHACGAYVTLNAGDDVTAATRLNNGYPDVIYVPGGETVEISSDVAITAAYVIGVGAVGATAGSVDARIYVEGRSHA